LQVATTTTTMAAATTARSQPGVALMRRRCLLMAACHLAFVRRHATAMAAQDRDAIATRKRLCD
jgi:hypothetical protein